MNNVHMLVSFYGGFHEFSRRLTQFYSFTSSFGHNSFLHFFLTQVTEEK